MIVRIFQSVERDQHIQGRFNILCLALGNRTYFFGSVHPGNVACIKLHHRATGLTRCKVVRQHLGLRQVVATNVFLGRKRLLIVLDGCIQILVSIEQTSHFIHGKVSK